MRLRRLLLASALTLVTTGLHCSHFHRALCGNYRVSHSPHMGPRQWLVTRKDNAKEKLRKLRGRQPLRSVRISANNLPAARALNGACTQLDHATQSNSQHHDTLDSASASSAPDDASGTSMDTLRLQLRDGELEALRGMRELLREDLAAAPHFAELVGDDRLLRFYRKTGTRDAAVERYREMLQWRRAMKADEVRRDIVANDLTLTDFPHAGVVMRYMPTVIPLARTY